jgi:hypothetical protein
MSKQALLAAYADFTAPKKVLYHELDDGVVAIETRQDVSHLVELAKAARDIPPDREFRLVGFVPDAVLNQAFHEGWFHDKRKWKEWLNNPDNRAFRAWEGRV